MVSTGLSLEKSTLKWVVNRSGGSARKGRRVGTAHEMTINV
jgi:hypothetical protein